MKKIITLVFCLAVVSLAIPPVNAETSSIQILSPAGNEQWAIGSNQIIKWSAPASIASVNITMTNYVACMYSTPRCMIATVLIPIASNLPNTGSYSWNISSNFSAGDYLLNIGDAGNSGLSANSNVFSLTDSTNLNNAHPAGSNVSFNGTVYYIQQLTLTPYTTAAAFLSYGFNSWSNVVPASSGDMALAKNDTFMPYAPGSLVNDNGTIYVISNNPTNGIIKDGITNASIFLALGYSWANVISGDTSFIAAGPVISSVAAHMPGTLINQNGTIYYISSYGKMGFPSMAVFNSWVFNLKNVAEANSGDLALSPNPYASTVSAWTLGQLSPAVGPAIP